MIILNSCLPSKNEGKISFDNKFVYEMDILSNYKIIIDYVHSMRIPNQQIKFTLSKALENDEVYQMKIETFVKNYEEPNWNLEDENTRNYVESDRYKEMQNHLKNEIEKYSKENINKTIDIGKIFFENIDNAIWEIDTKKLIQENNNKMGLDGSDVTIKYGTFQYYLTINVWSPKNNNGEVEKINEILMEIFKKANLEDWYE
jgi:hypothetical protein